MLPFIAVLYYFLHYWLDNNITHPKTLYKLYIDNLYMSQSLHSLKYLFHICIYMKNTCFHCIIIYTVYICMYVYSIYISHSDESCNFNVYFVWELYSVRNAQNILTFPSVINVIVPVNSVSGMKCKENCKYLETLPKQVLTCT